MGNALTTRLGEYQLPWLQLRGYGSAFVTADDTVIDIAGAAGDWDSMPTVAPEIIRGVFDCTATCVINVPYTSAGKIRTVEIVGYGTTAALQDCDWVLWAWRGRYSPAKRVAAGTAILGTMDVVKDPVTNTAITAFYVDTWGKTATYWGAASTVAETDDASNALSVLTFDLRGYQYLHLSIKPSSGTCASFAAAFSGY